MGVFLGNAFGLGAFAVVRKTWKVLLRGRAGKRVILHGGVGL